MVIRPLSRTALVLDIVGAFVLFAVLTPISLVFYAPGNLSATVPSTAWRSAALVVAAVLQCGGVAIGRLAPGLALAAAWVGAIVQMAAGFGPLPINLAILGVLYATAAWGTTTRASGRGSARRSSAASSPRRTSCFVNGVLRGRDLPAAIADGRAARCSSSVLALGSPWVGGFAVADGAALAAQPRGAGAGRVAAAEEQERVRIARDMHDVVAHSLAVIIAQADGARYAAAAEPEMAHRGAGHDRADRARRAVATCGCCSPSCATARATGRSPRSPTSRRCSRRCGRRASSPASRSIPMPPGEPPGAIQLAVYRILQEALTNAIRHGDGGAVDVRLAWLPERVDIEVRNTVVRRPVGGRAGGHGLIGMRERAQLVGGSAHAERGRRCSSSSVRHCPSAPSACRATEEHA